MLGVVREDDRGNLIICGAIHLDGGTMPQEDVDEVWVSWEELLMKKTCYYNGVSFGRTMALKCFNTKGLRPNSRLEIVEEHCSSREPNITNQALKLIDLLKNSATLCSTHPEHVGAYM
ncbi:hypothetical protein V8G54_013953 [Vigna mungo]|uniref:Uncharacterized protein n=1 Tax=Vigna mungo TaxID=3915 RepID=A0AAQ3RY57_VIGMU